VVKREAYTGATVLMKQWLILNGHAHGGEHAVAGFRRIGWCDGSEEGYADARSRIGAVSVACAGIESCR
jgi:hypothetical protein